MFIYYLRETQLRVRSFIRLSAHSCRVAALWRGITALSWSVSAHTYGLCDQSCHSTAHCSRI